jgi:outer membrane receptor protein involved in Fe transport
MEFKPDKTQNYEIGVKADAFDHLLSFDASAYYIDWKDIQLSLVGPPPLYVGYIANASRAKSQGVELSIASRPLQGLTLNGWFAWNDAKLTEAFPSTSYTYGASGDRLPYSARYSGNLSAEQDFPLANRWTGFIGGSVSYVGDRKGEFNSPPPTPPERQDYPAYVRTDLRAGAKYDSWTVNLYANNVADKRGLLSGGIGDFPSFRFIYIQPRTVGISVIKSF